MSQNRRQFIETTTLSAAAVMTAGHMALAQQKKLKACLIGDTPEGPLKEVLSTGYSHQIHRAFLGRDDITVVGLADANEEALEAMGDQVGEMKEDTDDDTPLKTFSDYREMLEMEKPELVAVSGNRAARHIEPIVAALECGAHVLTEKPFAISPEEADRALALADSKNLKIAVAHQMRMNPRVAHLKKLIGEGLIGDLLEVRSRGKEDHRAGGEDLIVMGTHNFDMMQYFLGQPVWCLAQVLQGGKPIQPSDVHQSESDIGPIAGDEITAMYQFDSGIIAHFDSKPSEDKSGQRWGLNFYGSKGFATVRMHQETPVGIFMSTAWAPLGEEDGWKPLPDDPGADYPSGASALIANNKAIVDDLVACIGTDRKPATGGREAAVAIEMIAATYAAQIAGGRVDWPLKDRKHPLQSFR